MTRHGHPITILMADDDADDRQMTREAFDHCRVANDLQFVETLVSIIAALCEA